MAGRRREERLGVLLLWADRDCPMLIRTVASFGQELCWCTGTWKDAVSRGSIAPRVGQSSSQVESTMAPNQLLWRSAPALFSYDQ